MLELDADEPKRRPDSGEDDQIAAPRVSEWSRG